MTTSRLALLLVSGALAAPALSQPNNASRPVSVQEARRFGDEQARFERVNDVKALRAYRPTTVVLVQSDDAEDGKLTGSVLTGKSLLKELRESLAEPEAVPSGTSCHYELMPTRTVLETCAVINVQRPVATFTVAVITRDTQGLYFSTVLMTPSQVNAQFVRSAALGNAQELKSAPAPLEAPSQPSPGKSPGAHGKLGAGTEA